VHGAAGLKQFPIGADVGPALPVPVEVRTGEDAVSMTERNCAKCRKDSVPVGLREKGFWALIYLCSAVYLFVLGFPSFVDFGFWFVS
jgi:hypothetical protein